MSLSQKTSGGSNYNWQLRMLKALSNCCTNLPNVTQVERGNILDPPIGMLVFQTDGTEGIYVYKSTGWVFVAWVYLENIKMEVSIDAELILTKSDETTKQESFKIITPSKMYELAMMVQEIINNEATRGEFNHYDMFIN